MGRVVHFEINADDVDRAKKFYEEAFDWKIEKWDKDDYMMVSTGDKDEMGINGGIMKRMGSETTTNTIDVKDVDEAVEKVTKAGGTVARPKFEVEGVGFMAYCKDSEGNVIGLMQMTGEM